MQSGFVGFRKKRPAKSRLGKQRVVSVRACTGHFVEILSFQNESPINVFQNRAIHDSRLTMQRLSRFVG